MRVVVLGAGGHSREVADLVFACGHTVACFQDDTLVGVHVPTGIPIVREWTTIGGDVATIAVGDSSARRAMYERLKSQLPFPVLVHPVASVSQYAKIGAGAQVMQYVVVSAAATVGDNVILNVGCFVAHDCIVGAHSHIAPGVLIGGGASVGEACLIGSGAILLPCVKVGSGCVVGAGAVVTRDVADGECVMGVPAVLHDNGFS